MVMYLMSDSCLGYLVRRHELAKDHLLWTRPMSFRERFCVRLWMPDFSHPILTWLEPDATWHPVGLTFPRDFSARFPGQWVPAQWTPCRVPQLVRAASSPHRVSVLFECPREVTCGACASEISSEELAERAYASTDCLSVLGYARPGPPYPSRLRDGDVIYERSTSEDSSSVWADQCSGGYPAARPRMPIALSWAAALALQIACTGAHRLFALSSACSGGPCQPGGGHAAPYAGLRLSTMHAVLCLLCAIARPGSAVGCGWLCLCVTAHAAPDRPASLSSSRTPPRSRRQEPALPHRVGRWLPELAHPAVSVVTGRCCHCRVLCPFRGWSNSVYIRADTTHEELLGIVGRHAGAWAEGYLLLGGDGGALAPVLLPTVRQTFAVIVLHAIDLTRALLVPEQITCRRLCTCFRRFLLGLNVRICVPPSLRHALHYPDAALHLRHGDSFELSTDEEHTMHRYREPIMIADSFTLPHSNVWHLPFRVQDGAWAFVWSPASPSEPPGGRCRRVWVQVGACAILLVTHTSPVPRRRSATNF